MGDGCWPRERKRRTESVEVENVFNWCLSSHYWCSPQNCVFIDFNAKWPHCYETHTLAALIFLYWARLFVFNANHSASECHSPCWMTIYNRILINFVVLVIHHCCQGRLQTTYSTVSFLCVPSSSVHYPGEIWKRSFISTARPAVQTNPSRKRTVKKTLFKAEDIIWKRIFVFAWTENILTTELYENSHPQTQIQHHRILLHF